MRTSIIVMCAPSTTLTSIDVAVKTALRRLRRCPAGAVNLLLLKSSRRADQGWAVSRGPSQER
jgi:hypothetical protein